MSAPGGSAAAGAAPAAVPYHRTATAVTRSAPTATAGPLENSKRTTMTIAAVIATGVHAGAGVHHGQRPVVVAGVDLDRASAGAVRVADEVRDDLGGVPEVHVGDAGQRRERLDGDVRAPEVVEELPARLREVDGHGLRLDPVPLRPREGPTATPGRRPPALDRVVVARRDVTDGD